MHVYFVRHGQTPLNKRNVHQSPNTPLSPEGRSESESVAEYLRCVNPDLLISSEYTRAKETANIIGLHTGLSPIVNGLFYEVVRPSDLYDKSHFHIKTLWYVVLSVLKRNDSTWRYKDAENFSDITNRANKALFFLESLENTHASVVVVSHAIYINIMVAYLCKKQMFDMRDLILTFFQIKQMKNTGIIHVELSKKKGTHMSTWSLIGEV